MTAARLHCRVAGDVDLDPSEDDLLRAGFRALNGPARRVAAMTIAGIATLHGLEGLAAKLDAVT